MWVPHVCVISLHKHVKMHHALFLLMKSMQSAVTVVMALVGAMMNVNKH